MLFKKLCAVFLFLVIHSIPAQNNFSKYYNEGAQSIDKENFTSGIEKLSKALEYKNEASNNYKVADAYIYRGYCRYKLNNYAAALEDIDLGLKTKPEYLRGYVMKTRVYLAIKRYDDCIVWCDKGLEIKPNDSELLNIKSEALFRIKKYIESRAALFLILENDPKNTMSLKYIGASFLHQKLWDSSLIYFSKALDIDPLDFAAYYDRGIARSYKNDLEGSTADIKKAMQLDSIQKFVGYNNLGFYLKLEKKDFSGALEYFDKAIELKPDFAYAYSNRGLAKLNLNDIKGAFKDLRRSLELDNSNSYAHKNLGLIYLKDGQKKNACEQFLKSLELGYSEMYDNEVEKLLKDHCE